MSWARYDDELPYNRKVAWLKAHSLEGLSALALHLLANTWSRHEGHQGFIPTYIPEQLVGRHSSKLTQLLVEIGMFETVDGGWMINDYDEYGDRDDGTPASEKKARLSKIRAEAGRAGGQAKAAKLGSKPPSNHVGKPSTKPASKAASKALANGQQSSSPVPVPVPVPLQTPSEGGSLNAPRDINTPPPEYCKKHPNGTEQPCRPCATARRAREAFDAEHPPAEQPAAPAWFVDIPPTDPDAGLAEWQRKWDAGEIQPARPRSDRNQATGGAA